MMTKRRLSPAQRDVLYRLAHYAEDGVGDRGRMGRPSRPTLERLLANEFIVLAAEGRYMHEEPNVSASMALRGYHNHNDFDDWYAITPAGREATR